MIGRLLHGAIHQECVVGCEKDAGHTGACMKANPAPPVVLHLSPWGVDQGSACARCGVEMGSGMPVTTDPMTANCGR